MIKIHQKNQNYKNNAFKSFNDSQVNNVKGKNIEQFIRKKSIIEKFFL